VAAALTNDLPALLTEGLDQALAGNHRPA
jgi:hypothetical protein